MPRLTVGNFNTWSGCAAEKLGSPNAVVEYIVSEASHHDFFYLNEVHYARKPLKKRFVETEKMGHRIGQIDLELGNRVEELVSNTHKVWFSSHFTANALHDRQESKLPVQYGNMLLVKKGVAASKNPRTFYLYGNGQLNNEDWQGGRFYGGRPGCRVGHTFTLQVGKKVLILVFVHGLWSKQGKIDITPRRIQNTQIAAAIRQAQSGLRLREKHVLLIGDLNYTSQMECLEDLLAKSEFGAGGGVNLNAEFGITDTRTKWYPADKPSREADFAIASQNLLPFVEEYSLYRQAPSDHAQQTVVLNFAPSP